MTAIITKSKIESNAYTNVYELMNNRSNIADPRGSSAEKRPFILDSDPLAKSIEFSGFPYIVLELPTLEYSRKTTDGKSKFIKWMHKIIIRTAKDGSAGSRIDIGRTDMLNICDDLNEMFNSDNIRKEFRQLGQEDITLIKTGTDVLSIDQKMVYESTYELSYITRLQTSD